MPIINLTSEKLSDLCDHMRRVIDYYNSDAVALMRYSEHTNNELIKNHCLTMAGERLEYSNNATDLWDMLIEI